MIETPKSKRFKMARTPTMVITMPMTTMTPTTQMAMNLK
jgi:hypothetical protein